MNTLGSIQSCCDQSNRKTKIIINIVDSKQDQTRHLSTVIKFEQSLEEAGLGGVSEKAECTKRCTHLDRGITI